jgi:hypothetical protein
MMLDLIENTRTFSRKITHIGPLQPRRDMDRYSTPMCNPVTLECGHVYEHAPGQVDTMTVGGSYYCMKCSEKRHYN